MKPKFTYEDKQAILDRYISKSESPTSIIESVGISKAPSTSGYQIIERSKRKQNEKV